MKEDENLSHASARRVLSSVAAAVMVLAGVWVPPCWARPMTVVDSFPMINQIMTGSATSFAIRFDGPIDHAGSRLTLVTPKGTRSLRARLDSQPNTLFSAVGALPVGSYELRWEARAMDGEVTKGTIPFKVSAQ
jgi:methionine-rich copper-binding protein CopC